MPELYSVHRLTLTAEGEPLFAALAAAIPGLSRHRAREAVMAGLVTVGGAVEREPKKPLPAKAAVVVDLSQGIRKILNARKHGGAAPAGLAKPFAILHEDGDLLVVDKAPGVLSAPTKAGDRGHIPELLRAHGKAQGREPRFIGLVHRLDRETSGCLCFALTREAQRLLGAQFAGSSATRTYRALVAGSPQGDEGTLTGRIGRGAHGRRAVVDEDEPGKDAVTHWRVLRRYAVGAELEVRLETGRTHQIRIHLAQMGCPVWGDRLYERDARRALPPGDAPKPARLMLHAERLALDHPRDGRRFTVDAPLPREYREFALQLAQWKPAARREAAPRRETGDGRRERDR